MKRDLEAAILAERERWILSTRGADLPKRGEGTEVSRPGESSPDPRRDARARTAWALKCEGHSLRYIGTLLHTTHAQAGRLVKVGRRLANAEVTP